MSFIGVFISVLLLTALSAIAANGQSKQVVNQPKEQVCRALCTDRLAKSFATKQQPTTILPEKKIDETCENIDFYHYGKANDVDMSIIDFKNLDGYTEHKNTVVLLEGILPSEVFNESFIEALQKVPNLNIIYPFYGICFKEYIFENAIAYISSKLIDKLFEKLNQLNEKTPMKFKTLHFISLGTGAYVGIALSRKIRELHQVPERLTVLSAPSDNFYSHLPIELQNYTNTAQVVDLIHTSTYENSEVMGHADFYVETPNCNSTDEPCKIGMVQQYFAESLDSPLGFWGVDCFPTDDKCVEPLIYSEMGYNFKEKFISMSYYVEVNPTSPYAQGNSSTYLTKVRSQAFKQSP